MALDFLSALIHIPELWKGTQSKALQVKYQSLLNLPSKDYKIEFD